MIEKTPDTGQSLDDIRELSLQMYRDPTVAALFAEREATNEKYTNLAAITDILIAELVLGFNTLEPIVIADLGAGAHPEFYQRVWARLLGSSHQHRVYWVDAAQTMLDLAHQYLVKAGRTDCESVLSYQCEDMIRFLAHQPDHSVDSLVLRYTFGWIPDVSDFLLQAYRVLKKGGKVIATFAKPDPVIASHSSNARYRWRGQDIPAGETRKLEEGEPYEVVFSKAYKDPSQGDLPGARMMVYFHSLEYVTNAAQAQGFVVNHGDWQRFVHATGNSPYAAVSEPFLVLTKV